MPPCLIFSAITSEYVESAAAAIPSPSYPRSYGAWLYSSATASSGYRNAIFDGRTNSGANHFAVNFRHSGGKRYLEGQFRAGNNNTDRGTTELGLNTWYRCWVVAEATNLRKLYINGVLEGTFTDASGTPSINPSRVFAIGAERDSSPTQAWSGLICDVQVWDGAITADDIAFEYDNPTKYLSAREESAFDLSDCLLHWPCDEGSGEVIADAVNSVNGTLTTTSSAKHWTTQSVFTARDNNPLDVSDPLGVSSSVFGKVLR